MAAIVDLFPTIADPNVPPEPSSTTLTALGDAQCPTAFKGLRIRFPGSTLEISNNMGNLKNACDALQGKMTTVMQSVITGLKPIFDIVDLIQKIINCITAIPDAIANANPQPVVECIPALAEKLAELLKYLFPPIVIPPMISDILCIFKTIMQCLIGMVDTILRLEQKLERLLKKIEEEGAEFLRAAYDVGKICRESLFENMAGSIRPLKPITDLLNLFVGLVPNFPPIVPIASFEDFVGLPIEDIREVLEQTEAALALIPDTCLITE